MSNTPVEPTVEMKINGTWVDITNDVRLSDADSGGGISIKRGRANESPIAEATEVELTLNNGASKVTSTLGQVGCYSLRNPSGPYYGLLARNQPIRIGVNRLTDTFARTGTDTWGSVPSRVNSIGQTVAAIPWNYIGTQSNFDIAVSGNATIVSDASNYQIAHIGTYGDADILVKMKSSSRTTTEWGICARAVSSSEFVTVHVVPGSPDTININRTVGGVTTTSTFNSPVASFVAGTWYWMRVQVNQNWTRVHFWVDGGSEPTAWLTRQATNRTAANNILSFTGGVGVFAYKGAATITVGSITINQWRAHAEVQNLPVRFDLSQQDNWVSLSARGLIQRYSQGRKALGSSLFLHMQQYLPSSGSYLNLEDVDTDAGSVGNVIPGAAPGKYGKISAGTPDLAGVAALPGSTGYINLGESSGSYFAAVPTNENAISQTWSSLIFFNLEAAVASDTVLFVYAVSGTCIWCQVVLQANNTVRVEWLDTTLGVVSSSSSLLWDFADIPIGSWIACNLYVFQSGGTVTWAWNYHRPGGAFFYTINSTFSGTVDKYRGFRADGTANTNAVGGLKLTQYLFYAGNLPFVTADFATAAKAYIGETLYNRVRRQRADSGWTVSWQGLSTQGNELLGSQQPAKRLEIFQDCADTTDSSLEEDRMANGFVFRPRDSIYATQPTPITLAAGYLTAPLEPEPDDQQSRNYVTVSGQDGGQATAIQTTGPMNINEPEVDPQGIGLYDSAPTLNLLDDGFQLQAAANWLLSKGTNIDPRYVSLHIDLTSSLYASAARLAEILSLDSGSLLYVTVPQVAPDPSIQVIQAYEEEIDQFDWDITFTATPGAILMPGRVGYTSRVSPSNQVTGSGVFVSGTNTALSSAGSPLWVTTAADAGVTGFDILVAGVRLRVTSITGASSPQTINVQATPINGVIKTIPVGSKIELYQDDQWRIGR